VEKGKIVFRDEIEGIGWTQFPNLVMLDRRLTDTAKLLYANLRRFARQDGACFPGQERLAHDMNSSPRTIFRRLEELKEVGLITVQRRGRPMTNLYFIESLRDVYRVNKDKTLSDEAKAVCGLDGKPRPSQESREPAPEPPDVNPVAKAMADRVDPGGVIEAARAKTRASLEARTAKRLARGVRKEVFGEDVEAAVKAPKSVGVTVLERRWRKAFQDHFQASPVRWQAKDKKLLKGMMADSGAALVQKVLIYVVEQWDNGLKDRLGLHGYPNVGILSAWRATLFPEVESGVVKTRGTRAQEKLLEDEYREGAEDDGPAIGRGFG
jgi:hypothetical protein